MVWWWSWAPYCRSGGMKDDLICGIQLTPAPLMSSALPKIISESLTFPDIFHRPVSPSVQILYLFNQFLSILYKPMYYLVLFAILRLHFA